MGSFGNFYWIWVMLKEIYIFLFVIKEFVMDEFMSVGWVRFCGLVLIFVGLVLILIRLCLRVVNRFFFLGGFKNFYGI